MSKGYGIRLLVSSILFSILVFGQEVYHAGEWNLKGIFWVLYGMIAFGGGLHLFFLINKKRKNKKSK